LLNIIQSRSLTISIISIILISYGLFFYFQDIQQRDRQIEATRTHSQHIGSDLGLVEARLESLSNSIYLQQGDLTSNKTKTLMQDSFLNIDSIVDHLFIVNKTNIITIERICTSSRKTLAPVFSFSSIFMGLDGNYRIGINYSIINRETGQYMGVVGSVIPTENFAHYGNNYLMKKS
jgi:hypothetical protein